MGLFDNLRGQQEIALTPRSAMLLACISMVAADGAIDDDEISVIQRIDGRADTWFLYKSDAADDLTRVGRRTGRL